MGLALVADYELLWPKIQYLSAIPVIMKTRISSYTALTV
jgi:hypothetical protein